MQQVDCTSRSSTHVISTFGCTLLGKHDRTRQRATVATRSNILRSQSCNKLSPDTVQSGHRHVCVHSLALQQCTPMANQYAPSHVASTQPSGQAALLLSLSSPCCTLQISPHPTRMIFSSLLHHAMVHHEFSDCLELQWHLLQLDQDAQPMAVACLMRTSGLSHSGGPPHPST